MELSIKVIKGLILGSIFYFFTILISCQVLNLNSNKRKIGIIFGSILEKDTCNLTINDSIYFINKEIKTSSEIGISPDFLDVYEPKLNISISFNGTSETPFGDVHRFVKLDTIIYLSKGRYILIKARLDKINLYQQKKKFILD